MSLVKFRARMRALSHFSNFNSPLVTTGQSVIDDGLTYLDHYP